MLLRVEFYGIARQRAGLPHVELELPGRRTTLAEALSRLAGELPEFGRGCVVGDTLEPTLSANLSGQRFISDPATVIESDQTLLILSADAGG